VRRRRHHSHRALTGGARSWHCAHCCAIPRAGKLRTDFSKDAIAWIVPDGDSGVEYVVRCGGRRCSV
jgi:hypothetical protein